MNELPTSGAAQNATNGECACTLCLRRAGKAAPYVPEPVFETPKRSRGQRCDCRHCEALRAEGVV